MSEGLKDCDWEREMRGRFTQNEPPFVMAQLPPSC